VTLASDLIDMDARFQDFVIAHELLHMRVPTHGRLFRALMSAYVPDWRDLEVERTHGHVASRRASRAAASPTGGSRR
jgi:predicted metal-dependent hydrolase